MSDGFFSGGFYIIGSGIAQSQPLRTIKPSPEEARKLKIELLHELRSQCEKLEKELITDEVPFSDEFELYGRL
jgi:hypothetical protein